MQRSSDRAPLCRHHPDVRGLVDSKHFVNIQQAYEVLIGRSRGKETDGRGTSAGAGWSFHDWCAACSVYMEQSASLSSADPCLLISRCVLCVFECTSCVSGGLAPGSTSPGALDPFCCLRLHAAHSPIGSVKALMSEHVVLRRYWKFATARRHKPPPRAGGAVGAPAEQLHTQLHGLRQKAAARRQQQPPKPNPNLDPEPVRPSEAPRRAARERPPRTGPNSGDAPASAGAGATASKRDSNTSFFAASGSFVRAGGAASASNAMRFGTGRHARAVNTDSTPTSHRAAWAAPATTTADEAAGVNPTRFAPHLTQDDGMSYGAPGRASVGRTAEGQGEEGGAVSGVGLGHVVRCAREFLADVSAQRLSNNVVAAAIQVLGHMKSSWAPVSKILRAAH